MAKAAGVVNFYSVGDEFGAFSNFAAYPITLEGRRWPTSEHYFQAQKFEEPSIEIGLQGQLANDRGATWTQP